MGDRPRQFTDEELARIAPDPSTVDRMDDSDRFLAALISAGELTFRQASDIRNLVPDDATPKDMAGLIAGEFGVAPKTIARIANEDVGIQLKTEDVEERKRAFSQTAGNLAQRVGDYLTWPTDALGAGIRAATGIQGVGAEGGFFSRERGISGAILDTPEEAKEKAERARIRDEARYIIDQIHAQGGITDAQHKKMRSVTDNYNPETYADLFDELTTELSDFDYMSQQQAVEFGLTLNDLKKRANLTPAGPAGMTDAQAEPELIEDEQETFDVQTINTFDDLLAQAGYMAQSGAVDMPDEPDRSTFGYVYVDGVKYNFDAIGSGPDAFLDPATGSVVSMDQYNAIMASDALKQRYAELGRQQGWAASVTDIIDKRNFVPSTQRKWGGGPAMPMEDLNIPSVVRSEAWQGDLYDWQKGSGASQWRSMSAYSRRAKINYMVNQGIITESEREAFDSPFSIQGGRMWEQVNGVSRDLQISQYEAMNQLGVEVREIRDESRRGRGSSSIAPTYSVPASLRTIPDYKALAQETKSAFRDELGRDLEDWELAFLSEALGETYVRRNDQLIQAHRAAWEDSVSGGTVDVSDIEVEDPGMTLAYDIEDRYADEISRQKDVEEYAGNRQLLMDSITTGQRVL